MNNRRRSRKRSPIPVIIVILALILIALTVILVSRMGGVDLGGLLGNARNLFVKKTETPIVTVTPQVITPTPSPAPTPTPFPEPAVENSTYRFSAGGKNYNGAVIQLAGTSEPAYVRLTEFAPFLSSQMSRDASGNLFSFTVNGELLVFHPGEQAFTLGGTIYPLSGTSVLCSNGNDLLVPAEDILSVIYPAKYISAETGMVNFSDFDPNFALQPGRQIPIISYYTVSNGEGPNFRLLHHDSIIPEQFTAQMQYIHDNGFTSMTFEDLAHLETVERPVMITFDGCYSDVYTIAWPILKQYNIRATLFVWPDYIGQENRLTEAQLKEMASSGLISVQAAMETYTFLDYIGKDELVSIVDKAKSYVNTLTGRTPIAFAYSVGSINTMAKDYCASQFRFCVRRSSERPYDTSRDDGSVIYRYTIMRETPLEVFSFWLSKAK